MSEQIRAFIAIEMPDETKAGLATLQGKLQPGRHPGVKWVDPASVHLTLKFLGNIRRDQVAAIQEAISQASRVISPFPLQLGGLGAFPNLARPRVIWVSLTGALERLATLQRRIEQSLVPLGFARESRPFAPHLTLGRLREQASPEERRAIGELVKATPAGNAATMVAREVSLMRSTLTPQGAIYNCIARIHLADSL